MFIFAEICVRKFNFAKMPCLQKKKRKGIILGISFEYVYSTYNMINFFPHQAKSRHFIFFGQFIFEISSRLNQDRNFSRKLLPSG